MKKQLCYSENFICRKISTVLTPPYLRRKDIDWIAPRPQTKESRVKRLDFEKFEWSRYISEERLLEAIPTVYGCDPRDHAKYRALLDITDAEEEKERSVEEGAVESD